MAGELDAKLRELSTPEEIRLQYLNYKHIKIDKLRSQGVMTAADLKISQGAPLAEVLALDELVADFPVAEFVTTKEGKRKRLINIPMGADGVTFQAFEQDLVFRAGQISK
jgi:hypothetical protein